MKKRELEEKIDSLEIKLKHLENDYILFLEHDLYNECCTLKMTEKGVRVDKTFKMADC